MSQTKPTAAPAHFPYRHHRNMAEVMREEALMAFLRMAVDFRRGLTVTDYA